MNEQLSSDYACRSISTISLDSLTQSNENNPKKMFISLVALILIKELPDTVRFNRIRILNYANTNSSSMPSDSCQEISHGTSTSSDNSPKTSPASLNRAHQIADLNTC